MKIFILFFTLSVSLHAATINVPADFLTIQEAIDAANDNDLIFISNNEYFENLTITNKRITLLGEDAHQAIINGSGSTALLIIGDDVTIDNLSFTNADDGISVYGTVIIRNCRFTFCVDGIDYESGGGECVNNYFSNNSDDAVDLDGPLDILIRNNIIVDNSDDGIEIRLHNYSGDLLNYRIENNYIANCGEDGIQLIDYNSLTDRVFYIIGNHITNSTKSAIGFMSNEKTVENFEGATIPEPVFIINNVFDNNDHGLTGGGRVTLANNIITGTQNIALKNVNDHSILSNNLLYNNGQDYVNCNPLSAVIFVPEDLNYDGVVNLLDLALFGLMWLN